MTQSQDQDREWEWSRTHVKTLGRYRLRDLFLGNIKGRGVSAISWRLEGEPEVPTSACSIAIGGVATHPGAQRASPLPLRPCCRKAAHAWTQTLWRHIKEIRRGTWTPASVFGGPRVQGKRFHMSEDPKRDLDSCLRLRRIKSPGGEDSLCPGGPR